jgi:hypothetical protein
MFGCGHCFWNIEVHHGDIYLWMIEVMGTPNDVVKRS